MKVNGYIGGGIAAAALALGAVGVASSAHHQQPAPAQVRLVAPAAQVAPVPVAPKPVVVKAVPKPVVKPVAVKPAPAPVKVAAPVVQRVVVRPAPVRVPVRSKVTSKATTTTVKRATVSAQPAGTTPAPALPPVPPTDWGTQDQNLAPTPPPAG